MIKVIKSDSDYETALAELERLIDLSPPAGTPGGDQLELLAILIEEYESKKFQFEMPDPVEAIKFRMEQQNLSPRDLVAFIGSRSKVSEILSGKRPLTLSMIRALHSGLGVPARVLLQDRDPADLKATPVDWEKFPLREMIARGWIREKVTDLPSQAESVLRRFFAPLSPGTAATALYRQTHHVRSAREMDPYALAAWTARVANRALEDRLSARHTPSTVNMDFMRDLVRLSILDTGPLLAREYLRKHGISLVIEPHLSHIHLDGAAIIVEVDRPVVALTLRYDRIDNFWFCLMHELAHISLHFGREATQFYDDLDVAPQNDSREEEADRFAGEALVPEEEWQASPASRLRSPEAAQQLAARLRIHAAIVAGRIRHHYRSYRVLNQLVGHGQVRSLFRKEMEVESHHV